MHDVPSATWSGCANLTTRAKTTKSIANWRIAAAFTYAKRPAQVLEPRAPSIIVPDLNPSDAEGKVGLSRPEGMDFRAGEGGRTEAHQSRSRSRSGDRRDYRPRLQVG